MERQRESNGSKMKRMEQNGIERERMSKTKRKDIEDARKFYRPTGGWAMCAR